jgi:hypothetical protein
MSTSRSPFDKSPFSGIVGLLVGVLIIYLLFNVVGWIVWLLYKVAWIIFIASLVIDHTVFLGYAKSIGRLFERNWMMGLAAGALSLFLYPFVFLYLLGMALFKKKIKEKVAEADVRQNGEWAEYEELPAEPMDLDIDYEELPPAPPEPLSRDGEKKKDTGYDELFE